ncbi:MAG: hypothetical protein RIB32_00705 [Phycisphaerales bacterium]
MTKPSRRGVVVLVLVVVLALINIALISGAAASSEDAHAGVMRVDTIRAFYAAESGGMVAAKGLIGDIPTPTEGSSIALGSQAIHFIEVREATGDVVVEGRAGSARRRVTLRVE